MAAYGFGLFERSWVLRGFENVLMDVVVNADFYEELLDKLLAHQMEILDRLLKFPSMVFGFLMTGVFSRAC